MIYAYSGSIGFGSILERYYKANFLFLDNSIYILYSSILDLIGICYNGLYIMLFPLNGPL